MRCSGSEIQVKIENAHSKKCQQINVLYKLCVNSSLDFLSISKEEKNILFLPNLRFPSSFLSVRSSLEMECKRSVYLISKMGTINSRNDHNTIEKKNERKKIKQCIITEQTTNKMTKHTINKDIVTESGMNYDVHAMKCEMELNWYAAWATTWFYWTNENYTAVYWFLFADVDSWKCLCANAMCMCLLCIASVKNE